jgi:anti-sigma factor RsiW
MHIREKLAGYLDGTLRGREHAVLREHLNGCAACRREQESYLRMQTMMSRVKPVAPPRDLPVRIRVAVSDVRHAQPWPRRAWDRVTLVVENLLEPIALPATGGLMATLMIFAVVLQQLLVGVPLGAVPNDVRLNNLFQPARLEQLAWFNISDAATDEFAGYNVLLVEATVNEKGEAVGYDIISGPQSPAVRRKLDQVMMFSRFRPQMSFGRPVPGGRVVFNLTEIRVRG